MKTSKSIPLQLKPIHWQSDAHQLVLTYEREPDGHAKSEFYFADKDGISLGRQSFGPNELFARNEILQWLTHFINDKTVNSVNMCTLMIYQDMNYVLVLRFQKDLDWLRMEEHRLDVGDAQFKEDYVEYLQSLPDGYNPPKFEPEKLVGSIAGKVEVLQENQSDGHNLTSHEQYEKNRVLVETDAANWRTRTAQITESQALGTIRENVANDLPRDAVAWAVKGEISLPDPGKGEVKVHLSGTWWFKRKNSPYWENFIPSSTLPTLHAVRRLRDIYADEGNDVISILVTAKVGEIKASIDLDPTDFPEEN